MLTCLQMIIIALYRVNKSSSDYVRLQEDINSVSTCIHHKQLQFNANKCKLMLITKKKANSFQPPQLTLNGIALNKVTAINTWGLLLPLIYHDHSTSPIVVIRQEDLLVSYIGISTSMYRPLPC